MASADIQRLSYSCERIVAHRPLICCTFDDWVYTLETKTIISGKIRSQKNENTQEMPQSRNTDLPRHQRV